MTTRPTPRGYSNFTLKYFETKRKIHRTVVHTKGTGRKLGSKITGTNFCALFSRTVIGFFILCILFCYWNLFPLLLLLDYTLFLLLRFSQFFIMRNEVSDYFVDHHVRNEVSDLHNSSYHVRFSYLLSR